MIINNVVNGGPATKIPGHLSFGQFLIDNLREHCASGDKVALINGDTGRETTYQQLLQEVVNVATGLKKLGVKRGDVVAIYSENRHEYIFSTLGAICCGAIITPVSVQYTKDEIKHALNLSRPNLIFCSEATLKLNLDVLKSLKYIKKFIQFDEPPLDKNVILYRNILVHGNVDEYVPEDVEGWKDTLFLLYSSGTTGLPKGVMLTHKTSIYNISQDKIEAEERRVLTVAPWFHAFGLMTTITNIMFKKVVVYLLGFNPEKYLNAIQKYKINILLGVPPIIVFLGKSPLVEKYDLSSIIAINSGAAPLSSDTIDLVLKRLPNCKDIYQAYAMTESSLVATGAEDKPKPKYGSGGYPIPGSKIKVVDVETRKKLGSHQKGEVCVKSPNNMKGYIGNEAATRAMFDEEGYLKTGDIGFYDEEGCIYIVDRLKELIKYKGFQVPPAEVESVLLQHSGVADCGVVGTPDEKVGELPTAFVVVKQGVKLTERELIDFAASHLSVAKRLHGGVIFVNEIPKNPSGKILRRVLKQRVMKKRKSKL